MSPPTIELLKKELGIEKASGEAEKIKAANASIEQIISVAKTKHQNMLANNLKSAVKTVVGTCVSSGILIESKEAKEIEKGVMVAIAPDGGEKYLSTTLCDPILCLACVKKYGIQCSYKDGRPIMKGERAVAELISP